MTEYKSTLIDWLKDAHAMEQTSVKLLSKQADRLKNYPNMEQKVREHAEESRSHAQRIEQCIKSLGDDSSTVKDTMGSMTASMGAIGNASASDEVVKNALGDYAFEQFEIASYRSLILAAEQAGEDQIASVCRDILKQEERMAEWVHHNLASVTQEYLQRELTGAGSKR